ncbi:MAG: endonuclease, partial [Dehalococcoidia bacterium]
MLLPGLTWILGDRFGLGALELGAVALILFAMAFLAGQLRIIFGNRWVIIVTAGGLGLLRFIMQFDLGEPLANLVLAMFATILFVIFLPIYLGKSRLVG